MSVIIGKAGPIEVSRRRVWDNRNGWSTEIVWKGTASAINGRANEIINVATSFDIDDSAPINILTARFASENPESGGGTSDDELIADTWELLGNDIEKDLFEHPKVLSNVSEDDIRTIKEFDLKNASPPLDPNSDAFTLYKLILKGTDKFIVSQYVLRNTRTVSTRYTVQVAFTNIEKIHSAAKLPTLPSGLLFTVAQIPAKSVPAGYQWGWLKKTPTVATINGGRLQITQEWWLEGWSTFIYDIA